ncbi:MAG: hypothetical protein KKC79_18400 [Gammaproteobacteria bacterium]|nr:hypothetical protein [Gammaproteobacteria bacterium]
MMLLIQLSLRWLMPADSGIESSNALVALLPGTTGRACWQHHGIAPIHKPPSLILS